MTELYVGVDPKGSHRVYRSKNGIGQEWVGPPFAEPRDAIAYAQRLRGVPVTTPSRAPSDGSTPVPSAPQPGLGLLEPSLGTGSRANRVPARE